MLVPLNAYFTLSPVAVKDIRGVASFILGPALVLVFRQRAILYDCDAFLYPYPPGILYNQ
jgi:hypothetical protein